MNAQIAKEIDEGMKNIEGKPQPAFKFGYGHMGNGLVVWNSAREINGDYEKVAHIDCDRKIIYYIKPTPTVIIEYVESIAA